jgi:hypothetical protein
MILLEIPNYEQSVLADEMFVLLQMKRMIYS